MELKKDLIHMLEKLLGFSIGSFLLFLALLRGFFLLPFILIFKNQIKNQKVSLKNQKEIKKAKPFTR